MGAALSLLRLELTAFVPTDRLLQLLGSQSTPFILAVSLEDGSAIFQTDFILIYEQTK